MPNNIAEVALPISIALNRQFDYLIPPKLEFPVAIGSRVLVPFRTSILAGYVVKLKNRSPFKARLRPIIKNLDPAPILDERLFKIASKIQSDYFCSLGDSLRSVIPSGLKQAKKAVAIEALPQSIKLPLELTQEESDLLNDKSSESSIIVVCDLTNRKRWSYYSALIKKTLNDKKSVIFLVPDHRKIESAFKQLNIRCDPFIITSQSKPKDAMISWMSIKKSPFCFVAGTRSAIFAPVNDLGLIIIEEEDHFAYRQDQVPHYRTSEIAFFRSRDENARVVLGSFMPSLETRYLSKKGQASLILFQDEEHKPALRLIDMRNEFGFKAGEKIISKALEVNLAGCLARNEKALIFTQKKGFSTFLYCKKCKKIQTCPDCSSSLSYHYKEKTLACPTCRYKAEKLEICPTCKSSYVKFFGFGIEKVESEILRLFPNARVTIYESNKKNQQDYDIMLATQVLLEDPYESGMAFDTVAILAAEQILGHVDFRTTEKAFQKLLKLRSLSKKEMLVQTRVLENDALLYLQKNDAEGFLDHELDSRRELELPPVRKMGLLMFRSGNKDKALSEAKAAFMRLKRYASKSSGLAINGPLEAIPLKVRGNFRYQIVIKYQDLGKLKDKLMDILFKRKKSVIVTFDPSPL
jgi:primosomal protein N' (replication factor Y)